eukprot:scaffold68520_cov51-Phaeocystis_antarctica.AAC.1
MVSGVWWFRSRSAVAPSGVGSALALAVLPRSPRVGAAPLGTVTELLDSRPASKESSHSYATSWCRERSAEADDQRGRVEAARCAAPHGALPREREAGEQPVPVAVDEALHQAARRAPPRGHRPHVPAGAQRRHDARAAPQGEEDAQG